MQNQRGGFDINIIRLNSGISRKEAHSFYRAIGFNSEKEQICFKIRVSKGCEKSFYCQRSSCSQPFDTRIVLIKK